MEKEKEKEREEVGEAVEAVGAVEVGVTLTFQTAGSYHPDLSHCLSSIASRFLVEVEVEVEVTEVFRVMDGLEKVKPKVRAVEGKEKVEKGRDTMTDANIDWI